MDLWLRNATVIRRDTGAMRAGVAVRPGRIAEIGRQLSLRADLEQDVGVVCPGFIDAHTHGDPR